MCPAHCTVTLETLFSLHLEPNTQIFDLINKHYRCLQHIQVENHFVAYQKQNKTKTKQNKQKKKKKKPTRKFGSQMQYAHATGNIVISFGLCNI